MDNIYLFLTNDGELDDRARRDRLHLEAAEQLGPSDRRRRGSRAAAGRLKWPLRRLACAAQESTKRSPEACCAHAAPRAIARPHPHTCWASFERENAPPRACCCVGHRARSGPRGERGGSG